MTLSNDATTIYRERTKSEKNEAASGSPEGAQAPALVRQGTTRKLRTFDRSRTMRRGVIRLAPHKPFISFSP